MDRVIKAIQQMKERMNWKFFEGKIELVTNQINRMEVSLNIVVQTASNDTMSILKSIDVNTGSSKQDVDYLAKQVGKHEMYFNRLNKANSPNIVFVHQ